MVDGNTGGRTGEPLRGIRGGEGAAIAGIRGAICRLCDVAEEVAGGRGVGEATGVLERTTVGGRAAGTAERLSASSGAKPEGRSDRFRSGAGVDGEVEGVEPARGSDAVHDGGGGIPSVAGKICGAGGCDDRDPDSESKSEGDGRCDRVLCEHAGVEGEAGGKE